MAKNFNLILLYSKLSSSMAVIHDLKGKGITTLAVDKAVELTNLLRERGTDMVGLSVNHPQAVALTEILKKNGQIDLFVFAEDMTSATTEKLNASAASIKVSGVGSGYTIWMTIGNIVKDKIGTPGEGGGKVVVHGGAAGKAGLGSVQSIAGAEPNMGLGGVQVAAGEVTDSGGTLLVREEAPPQDLGKISSPTAKKLKTSVLKTLSHLRIRDVADTDKFKPVKKVYAMQVEFEDEQGLFVIAANNGVELSVEDFVSFKKNMAAEHANKVYTCGELFSINANVDNICKWAKKNGQFALTFRDKADCVMAFLKCGKVFPDFVKTENTDMSGFELGMLPQQSASLFEIYLYLEKNAQLVAYFKAGDAVTTEQIQKLHQKGIKTVYVKDIDRSKINFLALATKLTPLLKMA